MPELSNDQTPSLQEQKLREEIRSLKLKYRLALLGVMSAVIAFVVENYVEIKDILYPAPSVKVLTKDRFLQEHGVVEIFDAAKTGAEPTLKTSVREASDWFEVKAGAYRFVVSLNQQTVLDQQLMLENGDREALLVQGIPQQIQLTVKNETPFPYPQSALKLTIESSGNGYLWIYELKDNNEYQKLYPPDGATKEQHFLYAGEPFHLPDAQNYGLKAGEKVGEENLLFVITSTHKVTTADAIAASMAKATTKASAGPVEENWGVYHLRYRVEL
jgi:hypothetical protein